MSKKFLPFTGRLAYRRDGRIDITSPDDSLSGFRVTLKPDTDSHSIAEEALSEAGLRPNPQAEYYAADLYRDAQPGILLGLTEEGTPLRVPVPKEGAAIWVLGVDLQKDLFLALLHQRVLSLEPVDLAPYGGGRVSTTVKTVDLDDCLVVDVEEAETVLKKLVEHAPPTPLHSLKFLQFPVLGPGYRLILHSYRQNFKQAGVVPIFSSADGIRNIDHEKDTVVFLPGDSTAHWNAGVPKMEEWYATIPLGRAFLKLPGETTAKRFRMM